MERATAHRWQRLLALEVGKPKAPQARATSPIHAWTFGVYIIMAYMVMACIVMAYMVMACIVMAYIVMAYMVMAYRVTAYIVMA